MEKLKGPFKDIILNFQKYKKSLGYKYDNINSFKKLDKTLALNGITNLDNTKIIFDFLVTNEKNYKIKKSNYHLLSQLYNFMDLIGYKNLYFKNLYFENNNSNFKPTILTKKQIKIFFNNLDNYCLQLSYPENYIYPVIFRLLYSSGLRISEALNLKTSDLSLKNRHIFISESKEGISRELPLSDSMFKVLEDYTKLIPISNNIYLVEINNKKISYNIIKNKFDKILENSKFHFRIHDLRHTMAITTFNNLFDKGYDEKWILYYLHFYLGHSKYKSTEKYLRYTDKRYKKLIKLISAKYPNIYPEMESEYER